jgi:hypothetical protein
MTPVPEPRLWNGSPREKLKSLEQDATRKHTDILGALSQEKCLLEKNIDELRAFAQEHHIRITACMRTSFRCWTSRIRHPSNPIHTQQA